MLAWRAEAEGTGRVEQELAAAGERANRTRPGPEQISFSWGGFCAATPTGLSPAAFLGEADKRMYRHKSAKSGAATQETS